MAGAAGAKGKVQREERAIESKLTDRGKKDEGEEEEERKEMTREKDREKRNC